MKFIIALGLIMSVPCYALFGEEMVPLLKLVGGQVLELEKLTQIAGMAKNQNNAIQTINDGIDRTVDQIETIQAIIERSQGVDPSSVSSIRELNDYLERVQDLKNQVDQIMMIRIKAADLAISQSSIQGDTAYRMGQEMIGTGSVLAQESKTASPGRASQISAASNSAQMMAKGVELQSMSQLIQLQAISLDLQKAQIDKEMRQRNASQKIFMSSLQESIAKKKPKGRE